VLFVATEARRAKIGTRILARLEDEARAQGVHIILVEAGARQREALALFRRQGYTQRAGLAADRREEVGASFEKPLHCGREQAACAAAPRRQ
jgi:putative acetyltransferase